MWLFESLFESVLKKWKKKASENKYKNESYGLDTFSIFGLMVREKRGGGLEKEVVVVVDNGMRVKNWSVCDVVGGGGLWEDKRKKEKWIWRGVKGEGETIAREWNTFHRDYLIFCWLSREKEGEGVEKKSRSGDKGTKRKR